MNQLTSGTRRSQAGWSAESAGALGALNGKTYDMEEGGTIRYYTKVWSRQCPVHTAVCWSRQRPHLHLFSVREMSVAWPCGGGAERGGAARRGGCKQTDRRIYTAVCTGRPDDADLAGWPEDLLPPVYGPPAMPPPARPCCFLNANPPRPELTLERPRDLPSVALQESTL